MYLKRGVGTKERNRLNTDIFLSWILLFALLDGLFIFSCYGALNFPTQRWDQHSNILFDLIWPLGKGEDLFNFQTPFLKNK
jgi:hypothetical protein